MTTDDQDRERVAIQRLEDNGLDVTRNGIGYSVAPRGNRPGPLILHMLDLDALEILARVLRRH